MAQNASIPTNNKYVVPQNTSNQTSNKNVNFNQKTDIHISGGGDPVSTARAIRKEQDAVNLQMGRNAKGAFD